MLFTGWDMPDLTIDPVNGNAVKLRLINGSGGFTELMDKPDGAIEAPPDSPGSALTIDRDTTPGRICVLTALEEGSGPSQGAPFPCVAGV